MNVFPNLEQVDRIGADTETTGLGYRGESYPVGFSWATPDGQRGYIRWGHESGGNNCTWSEFRQWAEDQLSHQRIFWHNSAFDLRMLAYGGHATPGDGLLLPYARHGDTQFMACVENELAESFSLEYTSAQWAPGHEKFTDDDALWDDLALQFGGKPTRKAQSKNIWRASGDLVAPYAEQDAVATLASAGSLLTKLETDGLRHVYDLEESLIDLHLQMHLTGVRADRARAHTVKRTLIRKTKEEWVRWREVCGREVNPNSGQQLAVLFDEHGLPYPRTKIGNPSFTKDFLGVLDHEIGAMVSTLRRLQHYSGTFIDSYILSNLDDNDLIHGEFFPLKTEKYGTVSGRYSSGGALNWQNVPKRDTVYAPLIRGLFIPIYDSYRWLKIDYRQHEYRFLAHYAGGPIMQAYLDDPDIDFHQMCADLTGIPRPRAKNVNFAKVYGAGLATLATTMGLSIEEATEFAAAYERKLPDVQRLYIKAMNRAARRGYIDTWWPDDAKGRVRRFRKKGNRYLAAHAGLNALLQGSSANMLKLAMQRVKDIVNDDIILHLTVHDELDFSVAPGQAGEKKAREVQEAMEDFELRVPVTADVEFGPDWGHVKKHVWNGKRYKEKRDDQAA